MSRWHKWLQRVLSPLRNRFFRIGLIGFSLFYSSSQITQPLHPLVANDHGFGWADVILVVAFSGGIFCSIPVAGIFFDRQRKRVVVLSAMGNFLCTIGFLLFLFFPIVPIAYVVLRFIQGFLFSMGLVSIQSMLSLNLDEKTREVGTGYISSIGPISAMLSALGGWLYQTSDKLAFLVSTLPAAGALVVFFVGKILPRNEEKNKQASEAWWKVVEPAAIWPSTPAFSTTLLYVTLISYWLLLFPKFTELFIVIGITQTLVRPMQGTLPTYPIILGGLGLMGIGWMMLVFYPSAYLVGGSLFGLGFGSAQARIFSNVQTIVPNHEKRGRVWATSSLIGQVGAMVGASSGGLVSTKIFSSYSHLWGWMTLFILMGIYLTWTVKRRHLYRPEPLKE